MKLKCVIVDDSAVQRMTINKLATSNLQLNLIGEFSNAIEAKRFLSTNPTDLIFLDIEMPVINGFDLLDGLTEKPLVIFITSKPEYAVKAFDYDATDYIQKPVTLERFEAAVQRASKKHESYRESLKDSGDFIFIKSNLKNLKVYLSKIKWIEAVGDYVKIVTEDGNHLVLATMKSYETDLPSDKFVRIHKSYIVNIEKIDKFNSKFAEIGKDQIPLSRNKKDELKSIMERIDQ